MNIVFDYTGEVLGTIYIQTPDHQFPSDDWTDFQRSIIADWVDTVIQNAGVRRSSFELYFMDGPYYLLCEKNGDSIKISGIDDHDGIVIFTESENFNALKRQLYLIAQQILDFHAEESTTDYDLNLASLKKNIKALI